MKKIFLLLLAFTSIAVMAFSISGILPIGSTMPKADVKLKDISGAEISIKEVKKENGVLVMFSCNTCPYVIKNQQRTVDKIWYGIGRYKVE